MKNEAAKVAKKVKQEPAAAVGGGAGGMKMNGEC